MKYSKQFPFITKIVIVDLIEGKLRLTTKMACDWNRKRGSDGVIIQMTAIGLRNNFLILSKIHDLKNQPSINL